FQIDDLAPRLADAVRLEERGERLVADEAHLHRLGLVGVRQAALAGQPAHLDLGEVAEREPHARKLGPGQAVEEVALVLAGIARAQEPGAARSVLDPSIMPG